VLNLIEDQRGVKGQMEEMSWPGQEVRSTLDVPGKHVNTKNGEGAGD